MAQQQNNNNGLYFIIGALLVAVIALGLYVANPAQTRSDRTDGINFSISEPDAKGGEARTDLNFNITDDGFKATKTTSESE